MSTSRIDVDLFALGHNLGVVRKVLSGEAGATPEGPRSPSKRPPGICAVVKQDAYGLGAVRVARRLVACGVDMLAVYSLEEARALVEASIVTPILVLMPVWSMDRGDPAYRHAVAGKLHLTVHDTDQLASISDICGKLGTAMPLHVQVDTGLARGGALPQVAEGILETIVRSPRLRLGGLMTHFASPCGDPEFTREQARLFRDWVERMKPMLAGSINPRVDGAPGLYIHAANSCAVFRSNKYHGNLVRVGQCLHGFALEDADEREASEFAAAASTLKHVVRWTSSVVHVKEIPTGHPVGYGSTWRAARPTRIALVPVGYADGYPRLLSSGAFVGLSGRPWERTGTTSAPGADLTAMREGPAKMQYVPVVGRVSMDQITIDVTDLPESMVRVGSEVEIAGSDRSAPNSMLKLAEGSQSIVHEQLCRIGARVERAYRLTTSSSGGGELSQQVHVLPDRTAQIAQTTKAAAG
ncbi:MAG: alanine racemase [Pyrinomonadaceae bacterium]|nr:alanine racemase [Phycisphaerales bacterium]